MILLFISLFVSISFAAGPSDNTVSTTLFVSAETLDKAYMNLGSARSLFKACEYSVGKEEYKRGVELCQQSADKSEQAIMLMKDKLIKGSEKDSTEFLIQAYSLKGKAYTLIGDWAKSLESHKEIEKLDPKRAINYIDIGRDYLYLEDYENAHNAFEKAIKVMNFSEAYYLNGLACKELGLYITGFCKFSQGFQTWT